MSGPQKGSVKAKIMIVDDVPGIVNVLSRMLERNGHEVVSFSNGASALESAESSPPDLILLDILVPDMDGYQICEKLKLDPKLQDIPVIFLSGLNVTESKIKAFHLGGVDYITKPFHLEEVEARVSAHLQLRFLQKRLMSQRDKEEKIRELILAQYATIFALAKLAEIRDDYTGKHLERVRAYCGILVRNLRNSSKYSDSITPVFVETILSASPLHDIGKIAIPDSILLKPGKLSDDEFEVIKTHTVSGAESLQDVYNNYPENLFVGMGTEIALYHHEKWDGSGYPDGLMGEDIPLSARITGLADFYDALRSDRCYREGFSHDKVMEMIIEGDGTHFDPEICKAFMVSEGEFKEISSEI